MPADILLIKAPIPDNVDDYDCYDDYEYVKKYFPEMFPVVGDILVGEVTSEKEYGYFITIARFDSRIAWSDVNAVVYRPRTLDGLLHKSNLNKNSPWSLANKAISINDYSANNRRVLVEVVDITHKGYALKELDIFKCTVVDGTLDADDLTEISMSKCTLEEKGDSGSYDIKEIQTETIQFSEGRSAYIFDNEIYTKIYHDKDFFGSSDLRAIMYFNGEYLCSYVDYEKQEKMCDKLRYGRFESRETVGSIYGLIERNKIHELRESQENMYKSYSLSKSIRERQENLFESFNQEEPYPVMTLYKSFAFKYSARSRKYKDSSSIHRYIDNEITLSLGLYLDKETGDRYLNIDGEYRKIYDKCGSALEEVNLINDEMILVKFGYQTYDVYFKDGIRSEDLISKYLDFNQYVYGHCSFKSVKDLAQGETK